MTTWILLILITFASTRIWFVASTQRDEAWFNFVSHDFPEHDCPKGAIFENYNAYAYASLYYPNRYYTCMELNGWFYYLSEFACPSGECYNASTSTIIPVPPCNSISCRGVCDRASCEGKFFPVDRERNCDVRRSRGPFIHPTDLTRQYLCRPVAGNNSNEWEFDMENRCTVGIAFGDEKTRPQLATCCLDIALCLETYADFYNQSVLDGARKRPSPPFPEIPADYKRWDDMLVPTNGPSQMTKDSCWPSGMIPYYIDDSLDPLRPNIEAAMAEFHQKTCIRFLPWSQSDLEYTYLFQGSGCYSSVGLQGKNNGQQLSLTPSCNPSVGVVIHLLAHTVGLYHEQNRSDRDEYLEILWDNIRPGQESNWDKLPNTMLFDNFTTDTIMINSGRSASKDGVSPTMADIRGNKDLSNMELSTSMSDIDARRINTLYGCLQQQ